VKYDFFYISHGFCTTATVVTKHTDERDHAPIDRPGNKIAYRTNAITPGPLAPSRCAYKSCGSRRPPTQSLQAIPAPIERNLSQHQKLLIPARKKRRARGMASEEGVVIACHTKDEFDAQMAKGKEAGKLVRTRAPPGRPDRSPSCSCDAWHS
jgi:hypothetical protein